MQAQASTSEVSGDHARRSLTRRIYLYLALFSGVIGGMVTAVVLLNTLLNALFNGAPTGLLRQVLKSVELLFLFTGLGVYHGLTMRGDGRITTSNLSAKHAAFPVLIFDPGDGFGESLQAAIRKAAPNLPVTLQPPSKTPAAAAKPRAVVLPLDLALDPPAGLRKWLEKYPGSRLLVPHGSGRWALVGQPARLQAGQTAQALRQLAEGQEVRSSSTPGWLIAVYILAGLFGLPILVSLVGSLLSTFMR